MNTKNVSLRMASRLQRILLAVVLVGVLFTTLPVNNAHAMAYFNGEVRCNQGYYTYTFNVSGDYRNQWVSFRFREYRVNANGSATWVKTTGWYQVQATGLAQDYINLSPELTVTPNYASKGTWVQVWTEAWFWDNVTQQYRGPNYGLGDHYPLFGMGRSNMCQIW